MRIGRTLPTLAAAAVTLGLATPAAAAAPPAAATGASSGVTTDAAKISGTVNPNGQATTYHFDYGPTNRYGSRTPDASAGQGTANVSVSAAVNRLQPNTTYHYRLVANSAGGATNGADRSFTTKKPAAPTVATGGPSGVTTDAAKISGTVNPNAQATTYHFDYGPTNRYGSRTPDASAGQGTANVSVSAAVNRLQPNTTYHYRLVANSAGGATNGADRSFRTQKPAAPAAATAPAIAVTADAAQLRGSVNAKGRPTTFHFDYGPTNRYGSRTPDASAGQGTRGVGVSAAVSGLKPNTTYHFRLVANSAGGVTNGADRSFVTKNVPFGLTLAVRPNPVVFGVATRVTGRVTGPGNLSARVVLQQRAFPFTAGFRNVATAIRADSRGAFAFAALTLPVTTQLRVVASGPSVVSQPATVAVAVRVGTTVSARRVKRNRRVRFRGTVRPAHDGSPYAIQKLNARRVWVTVAGGLLRARGADVSSYSRRVRVRRSGRYRVFVRVANGSNASGVGRTVHIITHG